MGLEYNPKQIEQLIQILQDLLPKEDKENDQEPDEEEESKIKTKSIRSDKISKRKNKFLDMPEKDMHKADVAIDKKLSNGQPTPRNRKFRPVDVICRTCGKKEKVNPAIVPEPKDRYKCNKCSTSTGN